MLAPLLLRITIVQTLDSLLLLRLQRSFLPFLFIYLFPSLSEPLRFIPLRRSRALRQPNKSYALLPRVAFLQPTRPNFCPRNAFDPGHFEATINHA
jgi:hypothetical protein